MCVVLYKHIVNLSPQECIEPSIILYEFSEIGLHHYAHINM